MAFASSRGNIASRRSISSAPSSHPTRVASFRQVSSSALRRGSIDSASNERSNGSRHRATKAIEYSHVGMQTRSSVSQATSPTRPMSSNAQRSPYFRSRSPSPGRDPPYFSSSHMKSPNKISPKGSMLRESQIKSPHKMNGSPGSPGDKLIRSRKENEKLHAELQHLRESREDIDARNQALLQEKEQVTLRLQEVQQKLHRETEDYFEQSAYAKSLTQQLSEEQQKVLKLKRAVDLMELDVQDLLAEKDTRIANLEATISAIDYEKFMVKTRLVQVEDTLVDERHRYAALQRRMSQVEDDLEAAKRLAERHEHLEVSKIEIERSVVEMRKRNDEIKEEMEKRGKQVSLLEEREAHLKSNLSALQSKIQSLEAAAQLQSLHLESVILKESSLKRDLEALTEEKQDIAEKMRTCAEQLTLTRSDAAAKETTIRQLSLKLQETEEVQKQAAHSAHVEHERATTMHQTLGSDNEMLQQKNFELTRALEASNKDMSELKARYDAKEHKYRSQRDLLARQSEVLRNLQDRCTQAEDDYRRVSAEMTSTWNQVTELRNSKKNNDEEILELKAQVTSLQKKATKGSDLNSKLLALMSQVVVADNETATRMEEASSSLLIQSLNSLSAA